jgi:hypothetical protein
VERLRGAHSTPFQAKGGSTVKAMTKTWLSLAHEDAKATA